MIDVKLQERGVEVAKQLIALGVPGKFACAMAGNAMLESGARTIAPSPDGSDGLWQWRNAADVSRLAAMKNYCAHMGWDWTTIPAQCNFAVYECQKDFPALWAMRDSGRTLATLTLDWCDIYERPAPSGRVPDIRVKYAKACADALGVSSDQPLGLGLPSLPESAASTTSSAAPVTSDPKENFMPALLSILIPALEPLLVTAVQDLAKNLPAIIADFQAKQPAKASATAFDLPAFGAHLAEAFAASLAAALAPKEGGKS